MEILSTLVSFIFNIIASALAFLFFLSGTIKLIEIDEIKIGKASTQLIAVILAASAFFQFDFIKFDHAPFIKEMQLTKEIQPYLVIETDWMNLLFKTLFSVTVLFFVYNFYKNWREELNSRP